MGRAKLHIKKGDKVVVITGAYKSVQPHEVVRVDADAGRIVVSEVNMRWKHQRRSQQNAQGGRIQKEYPIDASNVLIFSEKAGKGVRTRIEVKNGKRIRVGVPCGTEFD